MALVVPYALRGVAVGMPQRLMTLPLMHQPLLLLTVSTSISLQDYNCLQAPDPGLPCHLSLCGSSHSRMAEGDQAPPGQSLGAHPSC